MTTGLSYETVEKLRDAGFQWDAMGSFSLTGSESRAEMYPTLAELIAACGDKFHQLTFDVRTVISDKRWIVVRQTCALTGILPQTHFYGPTPEEAVAALLLALYEGSKD